MCTLFVHAQLHAQLHVIIFYVITEQGYDMLQRKAYVLFPA